MPKNNGNSRNQRNNPYQLEELFIKFNHTPAGIAWRWRTELLVLMTGTIGVWELAKAVTTAWLTLILIMSVTAVTVLPWTRRFIIRRAWCVLSRHRIQKVCFETRMHTRSGRLPLVLRIPAWATGATVAVNGQQQAGVKAGEFFRVQRSWKAGDRVEIRFPMAVRTSSWFNNSISVERGPLVYSLKIGESWHKIKQTGPAADWEVYPTTPWNYALVKGAFQVTEKAITRQPYTADAAPVEITTKARRLPQWTLVDDSPGVLPVSPVTTKRAEETVTLVPYGAAKLRITAFPWME